MRIAALRVVALVIALVCSCVGQSMENGIEGILPLVSTKKDVEKAFGKGQRDSDGFYFFRTTAAFLRFDFSTHRCEDVPFGRGNFDVPPGTVRYYSYNPNEAKPLSSIIYNKEEYYEDRSGSARGGFTLISKDNSIRIEVQEQITPEKTEWFFVGALFRFSKEQRDRFRCKDGN